MSNTSELSLSAAEREAARQQAAAAALPSPPTPEQKAALEESAWRHICAWACSADPNDALSRQPSVSASVVGLLDEAKVAEWEAALRAKGFVTERVGPLLIVSLPASL